MHEKINLKVRSASIGFEPDHESGKIISVLWKEKFKNCKHESFSPLDLDYFAKQCRVCRAIKSYPLGSWGSPIASADLKTLQKNLNVRFLYNGQICATGHCSYKGTTISKTCPGCGGPIKDVMLYYDYDRNEYLVYDGA